MDFHVSSYGVLHINHIQDSRPWAQQHLSISAFVITQVTSDKGVKNSI